MTYLFHSRFRLLLLFTGLGIGLFSCLDEVPTDQLTRILQYHVVAGQTFSTELEAGSVNTLLDEDFTVTFSNAIVLSDDVNGNDNAVVVAGNLLGTNGVVHVIDRVLRPE